MTALRKLSARENFAPLRLKLWSLGVRSEDDVEVILSRIRMGPRVVRGEDISATGTLSPHSAVLINGVACLYDRLFDGSRQIYTFQYPGDFCDLSRYVLQASTSGVSVAAVTDCSIGFIEKSALEQVITRHPTLARALWRSTILEAGALRARLQGVRQTALQRVAHLLCEQLFRQAAVGIDNSIMPMSQIDLADATGLSVVHVNRTFRELQGMGLLAKEGRAMKVVDRMRLAKLAEFDGHYLNMPKLATSWEVRF